MSKRPQVQVTLHHPAFQGGSVPVSVPANVVGDLPALLVDPRDDSGRAVKGMWLAMGDEQHATTSYRPLVWPTGPVGRERTGL